MRVIDVLPAFALLARPRRYDDGTPSRPRALGYPGNAWSDLAGFGVAVASPARAWIRCPKISLTYENQRIFR